MPETKAFIDSNILLYLLSQDADKADQAERIARAGGKISVQVLNELANVTHRKLAMSWMEINEFLSLIRSLCSSIEPLKIETHELGLLISERYKLSVYDALIVAAALLGGCETLYSEDMQDGLLIENQLRICNPFTTHISSED
jgi:predicted nucleic acid-binding protein